jgi:hypothetical protein
MDIKRFLETKPEGLADEQFKMLHKEAINHLKHVESLLEKKDWEEIENLMGFSPSGDEMGTDKHFIEFDHLIEDRDGFGVDLNDVVERLKKLDQLRKQSR